MHWQHQDCLQHFQNQSGLLYVAWQKNPLHLLDLLDQAQGRLHGPDPGADDRADRGTGRGVRRAEDLPAVPGHQVQQGQDPVQDAHRSGHRRDRLRPAVRRGPGRAPECGR